MLKTMRANFKTYSWTLWLVILAFVAGFIFFSGIGGSNDSIAETDLLTVAGKKISGDEFQKVLNQTLDRYRRQMKGSLNRGLIEQLRIPEQVLQGMMGQAIVAAEAERMGLRVSEKELKDAILHYPAFQRDGRFIGVQEYESLLSMNQLRVEDFENDLKKEILAGKLQTLVAGPILVDESALREEYRKENDKADLETAFLRLDRVKETPPVSEEEIRQYFERNRARYQTPERRSGLAAIAALADFRKSGAVPEKDVYSFYTSHKREFQVAGKTRVSRILLKYTPETREEVAKNAESLATGLTLASFPEKAKELSQDEKAATGGDWGYFAWRNFSAQEQSFVDRLAEKAVSSPVDTGDGFAILAVSEKVPDRQETYQECQARIKAQLENEKIRSLAEAKIAKVAGKLKDAGKSFRERAEKAGLKVVALPALVAGEPVKDVDAAGALSRPLFTLKPGEASPVIESMEGLAVVQLDQVTQPRPEPLEMVRDRVRGEVETAKKLELLKADAGRVLASLRAAGDDAKIAEVWKTEKLAAEKNEYRRGNRLAGLPAIPGLDDQVFAAAPGTFLEPVAGRSEVVIARVKGVTVTGDTEYARDRETFLARRNQSVQGTLFTQYLMDRREKYPFKINQQMFEKIKESVANRYR